MPARPIFWYALFDKLHGTYRRSSNIDSSRFSRHGTTPLSRHSCREKRTPPRPIFGTPYSTNSTGHIDVPLISTPLVFRDTGSPYFQDTHVAKNENPTRRTDHRLCVTVRHTPIPSLGTTYTHPCFQHQPSSHPLTHLSQTLRPQTPVHLQILQRTYPHLSLSVQPSYLRQHRPQRIQITCHQLHIHSQLLLL